MASEEAAANTETEEETVAVKKQKRSSRRVSFADVEITSVHIFNRDDEDLSCSPSEGHPQKPLGLFSDLVDGDDFRDSSPNQHRNPFLRPLGSPSLSPSPFAASASASSVDDEENFFGPVSADFIRPERLLDSAASDDITMDSTAFSMHFRSLARSDSGGDAKTPMAHRLDFEEKTPSQNATPTDSDSLMVLTKAKKPGLQSLVPVDKVSGGKDSNDMSIVGENPRSFDYGRLSPRLDALLADGSEDLNAVSDSMLIDSDLLKSTEDMHNMFAEAVDLARSKMGEGNGGFMSCPTDQIIYDHQVVTPKQFNKSSPGKDLAQSLTLKESTPSRSMQDPSSASCSDMMPPFIGKVVLSPRSNSSRHDNNCRHEVYISQSPVHAQNIDNYSGQKRKNVQIGFGDGDHIHKSARLQRSPEGLGSEGCNFEFMLEHTNEINNGEKIGGDRTKNWVDILAKFLGDTKQLFSESIDKLNLKSIFLLEDILVHLLTVKKYEMLCSEIQSQIKADHLGNVRHKRVAETRLLLYKLVYEKAKLQLMGVKRDMFLKRVLLLSSGIQESQMLESKIEHLSEYGSGNAQIEHINQSIVDSEGTHKFLTTQHQVSCDKVTTMRQESEALDGKIKSLIKCFHSNCTMKGEPSCADTIALVHDHLEKRMCCRFIQQDLQLWEVDHFESRNGHYNILLNYQGYISQRFTVNAGPVSSIIISNKLNNENILKNFPNMDACTAFAFVFSAETTKKYIGSRSLAQETQITSSCLRKLLDVVEEVQSTQIEIRNLIQTSFYSPSVEQLDLRLYFIDFYSGQKVTLTLDMTCLNRGVYPSEILPKEMKASTAKPESSWPQSLIAEIRDSAENLRAGSSRIMRFCRCVSQLMRASCR